MSSLKVCVDAGHGPGNTKPGLVDSGATDAGVEEARVVYDYAIEMSQRLIQLGIDTFLTRSSRTMEAPYAKRAARAKAAGCVAFVSWHLNDSDDPKSNGIEVLYRAAKDKPLAAKMLEALAAVTMFRDRGLQQRDDVAVLGFGPGPSILIELGFVSHQKERMAVQQPAFRRAVCEAAAIVVAKHLGVAVPAADRVSSPSLIEPLSHTSATGEGRPSAVNARRVAALAIVQEEAGTTRRDARGRLKVYALPKSDRGGAAVPGYPYGFEVAGVNNLYHPFEAGKLKAMIEAGRHAEAEERVTEYIATYTDCAVRWSDSNPGVEIFLRDCVMNRGPGGAARILQAAVGFKGKNVDGIVGPKTLAAVKAFATDELLLEHLREARERYERTDMHRDESSDVWLGLRRRWDRMYALARKYV